jgi:hypothetical protein
VNNDPIFGGFRVVPEVSESFMDARTSLSNVAAAELSSTGAFEPRPPQEIVETL